MQLKRKIRELEKMISPDNDETFGYMEEQQYENYDFTPEHEEIYRTGYFNALTYIQGLIEKIL